MGFRETTAAERARVGPAEFTAGCLRLLAGGDPDDHLPLVRALAGAAWDGLTLPGLARADLSYWWRTWAARGLMWHWDPAARAGVVAGLADPHWRVREMCAKALGRNVVGDALPALARLRGDPVARVRAAAQLAEARIVSAGG